MLSFGREEFGFVGFVLFLMFCISEFDWGQKHISQFGIGRLLDAVLGASSSELSRSLSWGTLWPTTPMAS
eukprot:4104398-Pyramimonas_sp.AAC.1